jgi:hypothetical protein
VGLIEGLSQQRLDDRLPADVQLPCCLVEFLEHGQRKVHISGRIGGIILSVLVKKREMSSPLSAMSAISSAVGGLGVSSVFGIGLLFFTGILPKDIS